MSVNSVTTSMEASYSTYATKTDSAKKTENTAKVNEAAAVYESSANKPAYTSKKVANPEVANQIKAANDARVAQLENIVHKLISGQGDAYGKANNIWQFLASGNFTVDPATKAQAQADIAEDGYWGVNATSDRIVDFAVALAGDDPEKLEEMRAAFQKGFDKAAKTWGGELPDISQRTYDAVMEKFDKLTGKTEETTATN
ncbi:MAG: hypothetical protein E7284_00625 [Lachnospiraceae bacterium]|nr:hypothetical protein [Lachnospiraceae bacterium]